MNSEEEATGPEAGSDTGRALVRRHSFTRGEKQGGTKGPGQLVSRRSLYNMNTTIRTVRVKDVVDGMGFIYKRSCDWSQHFPEANGHSQSPININSRDAVYDPVLNQTPLQFNYGICRETDVCNNGYAIICSLRFKPGEATFRTEAVPKSFVSGGPLTPRHEYELVEIRFHWGREDNRGSEHTVNCKAFPMELHMIHYNSTLYPSLEDALGKADGIIIVALIVQVGRDHPGIKLITEQLEDVQYKGRQKTITMAINPTCFLPDPMLRDYWTYEGSLTSPPCSENVRWIIFRYPLTISATQIEEFRRLRTYHKGDAPLAGEDGILVDNFRPTQQINDRNIRASFQT